MIRDAHLARCKQRALEYLDDGELANAVASMISDMQDIETVSPFVMAAGAIAVKDRDVTAVRRWIEGFT